MKIGIDISQIVYGTGVSVYTKNLIENLLRIDKENEYIFFFSSLRRKYQILNVKYQKLKIKKFKIPPTLLEILWNRWHICPIEWFIGQVDVFHTSDWTEPPAKKAVKVTTIHDLTPLLYPEDVHPKIRAVHQRKLEWVKKESKLIIAVSHSTKRDIVRLLGIPEEKIKVVYEGISEKFKVQSSKLKVEEVKKKYKIEGDYFLAFAGPKRKNLERIKKALRGYNLFIVGQPKVEEDDLPILYSGSLGLVYVSIYEGFGLPILEAQACGCPVITSNISSMPEVAGEGAVLVNPFSIKDIRKAVEKIIEDRNFKEELIKKGFENVKRFSWEKTAKDTLEVYKEAIRNF